MDRECLGASQLIGRRCRLGPRTRGFSRSPRVAGETGATPGQGGNTGNARPAASSLSSSAIRTGRMTASKEQPLSASDLTAIVSAVRIAFGRFPG
jgi:hypothetical protein